MTARTYLKKIRWNEIKIQERKIQLRGLGGSYNYMQAIDYARDKVQTSPRDSLGEMVARELDRNSHIAAEVIALIGRLERQKHEIIGQIQNMAKAEHCSLLFKIYVEHKDLLTCAQEMDYTYGSIANLHGEALTAFAMQYSEYLRDAKETPDA